MFEKGTKIVAFFSSMSWIHFVNRRLAQSQWVWAFKQYPPQKVQVRYPTPHSRRTRNQRRLAPVFGRRGYPFAHCFTQQWRWRKRSLWNFHCRVDGGFTPHRLRWNSIAKYLLWIWKWKLWVSSSNPGEDMWWPRRFGQDFLCVPFEIS